MKEEIFNEILNSIENEDIKNFALQCIKTIDKYFWEIPASSSLKYHSAYACTTPLGLAKHTVALVRFLNYMFEVESIKEQFTSRERDLLRIAGMMHDTRKSGSQEDFEKSKWTKFDHPLLAAEVIRGLRGLPNNEIELIAHVIESHMGQWNTDKRHPNIILPKPTDKYQIIVHLADYLASRKDIEMKFDNLTTEEVVPQDPKSFVLPFGKHKGQTLGEIYESDKGYLNWLVNNIDQGQTTEAIKKLFEEKQSEV